MKTTIQILLDLQNEDLEILSLQRDLGYLRQQVQQCEDRNHQLEDELTALHDNILYQESQKKLQEIELAKEQEHVDDLSQNLKDARNNKEYTGLNSQIKLKEADIRKIEEKILEIMETIEGYQNKRSDIEKSMQTNREEAQKLEGSIADEVKTIESGIEEHQKGRQQYVEQLDKHLCEEYERLFKRYEGEALCEFEDNACNGCFMTISSDFANKLRVGRELIRCPSCGRILFVKETVQ